MKLILAFFRIELVHLTPNSIPVMVVFTYICELYVRTFPDLEVFFEEYLVIKDWMRQILSWNPEGQAIHQLLSKLHKGVP